MKAHQEQNFCYAVELTAAAISSGTLNWEDSSKVADTLEGFYRITNNSQLSIIEKDIFEFAANLNDNTNLTSPS